MNRVFRLRFTTLKNPILNPSTAAATTTRIAAALRQLSTKSGEDEWNDAWETAWLPEDLSGKNRAPWETDVNFSLPTQSTPLSDSSKDSENNLPSDIDSETKAFVEEMTDNWEQRKGKPRINTRDQNGVGKTDGDGGNERLYSLENMKRDYRLKKQRIHAGLWMKEIEKMEEAKLADSITGGGDDIDKLLDSCSEIFGSTNIDVNNSKVADLELKNKPDGWETTTTKGQDASIWEMSQREEDILLQEFERRIAYNKFQIASFIKQHIFSRRRPIDGWKYMIEVIGPNAKKGRGSVSRLTSVSDAATQPFKEEQTPTANANATPIYKGR